VSCPNVLLLFTFSIQKVGKENETKEEVVELSSDDNEDSQEEIAPKTPSSNAAMDYQLFTLFSTPQNGKDSPSDKITPEEGTYQYWNVFSS